VLAKDQAAASGPNLLPMQIVTNHNKKGTREWSKKVVAPVIHFSSSSLHLRSFLHATQHLLDRGVDANALDNRNWSLLHMALNCGCLTVAEVLLNHGADIRKT
jgi:Ankyrin repeats (many copies)